MLMCKNLEYISLLQSRAMLAEPSKMHRNRPLAVHPATLVPPREGARPEYKSSKTLVPLHKQELTTSANRSKSCLYNPYAPMLANK